MERARTTPKPRHDGWTPERRRRFLEFLAAGHDISLSCRGTGLTRQAAYKLRRRDPAFAREWDAALQSARDASAKAFLATLPEKLLRTLSGSSTECKLHGDPSAGLYPGLRIDRVATALSSQQ
jgi:hypothetical protein